MKLSKKELEERENNRKQAIEELQTQAGKQLKSDSVRCTPDVIQGITEELGFTVIACDLCNWAGAGKSDRHPILRKETKKVGLKELVQGNERVVSFIYLDDYSHSLI